MSINVLIQIIVIKVKPDLKNDLSDAMEHSHVTEICELSNVIYEEFHDRQDGATGFLWDQLQSLSSSA